jgi:hypothetical protein
MQTGDADFAQFHSISTEVEDEIPSILDILKAVDATFRSIPHRADGRFTSQYRNSTGYTVEFLTPNRGGDDLSDKPARMPALGDTAAQPLRYMDFLIHEPVRAVMLHGDGIPVLVPAPERFAIHKLIIATQRQTAPAGLAKREKDLKQAVHLVDALATTRHHRSLADAFIEAWERGPHWREAIKGGIEQLSVTDQDLVQATLGEALGRVGQDYRALVQQS